MNREPPQPIYHFGHHKCLTVYFHRVLNRVAKDCGIPFRSTPDSEHPPGSKPFIFLSHDSNYPFPSGSDIRATHVIRDPRDLIVSGYFYHLRTSEDWCRLPNPDHTDLAPGVSYQQHLRSLSVEEGLCYEMRHVSGGVLESMRDWNYRRENCLELRFEDIVADEINAFTRILQWYGFAHRSRRRFLAHVQRYSRTAMRRCWPLPGTGHIRPGSHPGQWRKHFSPPMKKAFKHRYQDLLEQLGYERNTDW